MPRECCTGVVVTKQYQLRDWSVTPRFMRNTVVDELDGNIGSGEQVLVLTHRTQGLHILPLPLNRVTPNKQPSQPKLVF